ncbi:type II toxin-antitoxin system antitoxin SocA domain-containing protein [Spiroplasma chinense]|uniref:type II toxin-antitoxin system antitoxin SocA domain-containing protein n=1 Tax=Spiroplasma chinense TaxID=216932 RepID=UPI001412A99B|nr:type II toxin-antitoxin system antitoxin SocA domain-containing protein [Spiroplasma chinense]
MKDLNKILISSENKLLSEYLEVSLLDSIKINQAIFWLLDESEKNNFRIYKTHLLKFFSILELIFAQEYRNSFTKQQYVALENGPIPGKLKELIEEVQLNQLTNIEFIDSLAFKARKLEKGTEVIKNEEFVQSLEFLSEKDLEAMNKALKLILELKTVEKLSEFTHKSKSYYHYYGLAKKEGKNSYPMDFSIDLSKARE